MQKIHRSAPSANTCHIHGEAMAKYGKPKIFNTDQGSQFTSLDFTAVLKTAEVAISMDGRGRCFCSGITIDASAGYRTERRR